MFGYFMDQVLISCGIIDYQTVINVSQQDPADKKEAGVPGGSDVVIPQNRDKPAWRACEGTRVKGALSSAERSLFFPHSFCIQLFLLFFVFFSCKCCFSSVIFFARPALYIMLHGIVIFHWQINTPALHNWVLSQYQCLGQPFQSSIHILCPVIFYHKTQ